MSLNDPTDCGSAGHPMTCNCYPKAGDPDARPARAPQDEREQGECSEADAARFALERVLARLKQYDERELLAFRKGVAMQAAQQHADAALVAPREPALRKYVASIDFGSEWTDYDRDVYAAPDVDALVALKDEQIQTLSEIAANLQQSLTREQAESAALVAGLRQQVRDHEEREAACCPEDVGFEKVIAGLRHDLDAAQTQCASAERALNAAYNETEGVLAGLRALIAQMEQIQTYETQEVETLHGLNGHEDWMRSDVVQAGLRKLGELLVPGRPARSQEEWNG